MEKSLREYKDSPPNTLNIQIVDETIISGKGFRPSNILLVLEDSVSVIVPAGWYLPLPYPTYVKDDLFKIYQSLINEYPSCAESYKISAFHIYKGYWSNNQRRNNKFHSLRGYRNTYKTRRGEPRDKQST